MDIQKYSRKVRINLAFRLLKPYLRTWRKSNRNTLQSKVIRYVFKRVLRG